MTTVLFVFSRTPTSFIRMHSRLRSPILAAPAGSRPIYEGTSSLSPLPRHQHRYLYLRGVADFSYLAPWLWLSFLSRPTTFLRDQNRGAPLFATMPRETPIGRSCSFSRCPFFHSTSHRSLFIRDFLHRFPRAFLSILNCRYASRLVASFVPKISFFCLASIDSAYTERFQKLGRGQRYFSNG